MPITSALSGSTACSRETNDGGEMPSWSAPMRTPPPMPARSPTKTSSGRPTTIATRRGITSTWIGERPRVLMASVSSCTFIEPICAVNAAPERPATITATRIGESSRHIARPTPSTTKIVAP